MSKRERTIKTLQTEQGHEVKVAIDYRIGGMNYFTGNVVERGLHISVTPAKVSKSACGTYTTRSYLAFSGVTQLLKPMSRFNSKELDNYEPKEELVEKMLQIVAQKNNLTYIRDL